MRIAALVKQIPKFEAMTLGADGRLQRDGIDLELNAYCRRAVAQAVLFAQADDTIDITIITLGPPSADDCLREAIAWGDAHGVTKISGVHVCDPAFAGSDTLATALAITAALELAGPFDLILSGRNSVDADTGQVGPQIAELLDANFVSSARHLSLEPAAPSERAGEVSALHGAIPTLHARSETDDGFVQLDVSLPAVVSCAERLCDPAKVDPQGRAAVSSQRIQVITATELGPGPWGAAASPTKVGEIRLIATSRAAQRRPKDPLAIQVQHVATYLQANVELRKPTHDCTDIGTRSLRAPMSHQGNAPELLVIAEPLRDALTFEMLGTATMLASHQGCVAVIGATNAIPNASGTYGADVCIALGDIDVEANVASAITGWCQLHQPTTILAPSTAWGREVAARVAAALRCGLTGDAVELERVPVENSTTANESSPQSTNDTPPTHPVVAWKPAFGGSMVVAIHCTTKVAMATVRPGVLQAFATRDFEAPQVEYLHQPTLVNDRVHVLARARDDDLDALSAARVVIAIGQGVDPDRYDELEALREFLKAELAATRKVTDKGWLPRARQLGITGRAIAPELLISIGAHGKFNHSVGFRNARHVVAINSDAGAPIFDVADIGIVGDWYEALPALVAELRRQGFSGR